MNTKEISKVSVEKALAFIESGIYTKKNSTRTIADLVDYWHTHNLK